MEKHAPYYHICTSKALQWSYKYNYKVSWIISQIFKLTCKTQNGAPAESWVQLSVSLSVSCIELQSRAVWTHQADGYFKMHHASFCCVCVCVLALYRGSDSVSFGKTRSCFLCQQNVTQSVSPLNYMFSLSSFNSTTASGPEVMCSQT